MQHGGLQLAVLLQRLAPLRMPRQCLDVRMRRDHRPRFRRCVCHAGMGQQGSKRGLAGILGRRGGPFRGNTPHQFIRQLAQIRLREFGDRLLQHGVLRR